MKYALVNGIRQEAERQAKGICPGCGNSLIAKCGEKKIKHWAHKGKLVCDVWWENETEWHRNWKGQFPVDWQEIIQVSESGEKHIADVKTHEGWVVEFQHSYLNPEERRARNNFYKKLVWIVDGTRRKRDAKQFAKAFNEGKKLGPQLTEIALSECNILAEWKESPTPIILDFGPNAPLFFTDPNITSDKIYIVPINRTEIVDLLRGERSEDNLTPANYNYEQFINDLSTVIKRHLGIVQVPPPQLVRYNVNQYHRHTGNYFARPKWIGRKRRF